MLRMWRRWMEKEISRQCAVKMPANQGGEYLDMISGGSEPLQRPRELVGGVCGWGGGLWSTLKGTEKAFSQDSFVGGAPEHQTDILESF